MLARVLLPLAVVLTLVGTASAEKAKLAVLGLEVAGSIDTDSTSHGRLLTERFRAKIGISPRFVLAPNSMKDLLDEKVANGCDNEAPDCMAKIGAKLKVAFLMYGKIEKRPKDGKDGYQLSMKSLDIDRKTVKEWGDWVPLVDFVEPGALDGRVSTAFDTLTKDANLNATDPGGSVITGPTGPGPTPKPRDGGGFPWKVTAYTSTAVALAAFGGFIYYGPMKTKALDKECRPGPGGDLGVEATYTTAGGGSSGNEDASECAKGETYSKRSYITGIAAAALGGVALVAYYKGFVSKKETNTTVGRSTRKKKKQFAVTPIVAPDGAGATFRLDW
jgi:hypothetical protein